MSRPRKHPFLEDFEAWLKEQGLASSSASTYARGVSAILTHLDDDLTIKKIDSVLSSYANASVYRSAWRRFSEWASTKGASVPAPSEAKGGRKSLDPLPLCALLIIDELNETQVPIAKCLNVRWGQVQPDGVLERDIYISDMRAYARVKAGPVVEWEGLYAQTYGSPEPSDFFIPHSHDKKQMMPARPVRQQLKEHRKGAREESTPEGEQELYLPFARGEAAIGQQDIERLNEQKALPHDRLDELVDEEERSIQAITESNDEEEVPREMPDYLRTFIAQSQQTREEGS